MVAKDTRRTPRYRIKVTVEIIVRTIGSNDPYRYQTANVSAGGVFIDKDANFYPFNTQSILEVWVHAKDKEIFFLGKVAHMQKHGFGIKIIDITNEAQDDLNQFVRDYAAEHPEAKLTPPMIPKDEL